MAESLLQVGLLDLALLEMPSLDLLNGWPDPGSGRGRVVGLGVVGHWVVSPGWCGWYPGTPPGMGVASHHTVQTRWFVEPLGERVT